jgi:DNA-binding HxlR family transcriptional regulator
VRHRSNTLAFYGPEEVFKDLHSAITYHQYVLYITKSNDERVTPAGKGLLLIPLIFAWPDLYVTADPPWQPTIAYTPRGVGNLWVTEQVKPSAALSELIGYGRSLVLEQLAVARTTSDLAQALTMTPGAISQHLGRLRQVGVVESVRIGTRVYHRLTPAGQTLLELFPRSR